MQPVDLTPEVVIRTLGEADAAPMVRAYERNRAHLGPWDPRRDAGFYTVGFQRDLIRHHLDEQAAGRTARFVLERAGEIVGVTNLSTIVLGPYRSASLGYWIDAGQTGRGLATSAVDTVCAYAVRELGLHRLEASTLVHNVRSQRVLAKCGFAEYGLAPSYLFIDGRWQDHRLFQRILSEVPPAI